MRTLSARVDQIIAEKERELQGSATPGTAILLASYYKTEQAQNDTWLAANVGELKTSKARTHRVDGDAYAAGKEYGKSINLSEQLGSGKSNKQIR
jgi:hypothetical protein